MLIAVGCILSGGCMKWEYGFEEDIHTGAGRGVFILNEGNFQYGNASLSYYDIESRKVENEVFYRANGMKLGDVAQSMTIGVDGRGWICVNNSHVVFSIDTETCRETGRIENAGQPRYVEVIDSHKLYITQIWDNRILIADPVTFRITGEIEVPGMEQASGSTEQMVRIGNSIFCNCWSYQNRIIRIDTESDRVTGSLTVGSQPNSMAVDHNGKLWILTDGGDASDPANREAPTLVRINPGTLQPEICLTFPAECMPSRLCTDGAGMYLYWLNNDVWRMSTDSEALPEECLIAGNSTLYYGLAVDPESGNIFVADAIDYQQRGKIIQYSAEGNLINQFYAGITPGNFCFKPRR